MLKKIHKNSETDESGINNSTNTDDIADTDNSAYTDDTANHVDIGAENAAESFKYTEKTCTETDSKKTAARPELVWNTLLALLMLTLVAFYFYKNEFLFPRGYGFFEVLKPGSYEDFDRSMKRKLKQVEKDYNESFYRRMDHIDAYGYINQTAGRTVLDDAVSDRSIVKGSEGILYYIMQRRVLTSDFVHAFARLYSYLAQKKIPFVYMQAPNKHMRGSEYFPSGVMDYSNVSSEAFLEGLAEKSVPFIDLDTVFRAHRKDEKEMFYKTDNHWNIHGAFLSYVSLIRYLETLEIGDRLIHTKRTTDKNRYELHTRREEYIGGQGRRVGIGYSDVRDDYEILLPKDEGEYLFEKKGVFDDVLLSRKGRFQDVFYFSEYLETEDIYGEKYTAFMGEGTAEEVIRNFDPDASINVLIIKDSFAMPIAGFLSQNCREITLLDIRSFARPRSIEAFVEEGDFDLVLFIASPIGMLFFPEMFTMPEH